MNSDFFELLNCRVAVTLPWPDGNRSIVGTIVDFFEINDSLAAIQWAKLVEDDGQTYHLVNLCQATVVTKLVRQYA